ncbi:MAG TPA: hypothetical protein VF158_00235 [Longimicrobiales bacterium]
MRSSRQSAATGARRGTAGGAALAALVLLGAGQGCYGYVPADLTELRSREEVRVVVDAPLYRRIAPTAPLDAAPRLDGEFLRATDDSVALSVWIGQAYRGTPFETAHQVVVVPREGVVAVERRRLSVQRTTLLAAGVAGLVAYLVTQLGSTSDPNPGIGGAPPPPPAPALVR